MRRKLGFKSMFAIDHVVGLPLCFLIGIWITLVNILSLGRKPHLPKEPKAILVLKWFGMGSIALMRDLIFSLQKRLPETKILFLSFQNNKDLINSLSLAEMSYKKHR